MFSFSVVIAISIIHVLKQAQITMYLYALQCRLLVQKRFGNFFSEIALGDSIMSRARLLAGVESVLHSLSIASHSVDCRSDDRASRFVSLDSIPENVVSCQTQNLKRRLESCASIRISRILIFHTKAFSRQARLIGR